MMLCLLLLSFFASIMCVLNRGFSSGNEHNFLIKLHAYAWCTFQHAPFSSLQRLLYLVACQCLRYCQPSNQELFKLTEGDLTETEDKDDSHLRSAQSSIFSPSSKRKVFFSFSYWLDIWGVRFRSLALQLLQCTM